MPRKFLAPFQREVGAEARTWRVWRRGWKTPGSTHTHMRTHGPYPLLYIYTSLYIRRHTNHTRDFMAVWSRKVRGVNRGRKRGVVGRVGLPPFPRGGWRSRQRPRRCYARATRGLRGPVHPLLKEITMFECSCVYAADQHGRWARRVRAAYSRYAVSYDMLVQAVHDWALCPPSYRAANYEFAVACMAQVLYGSPSSLASAYSRALKAHGPDCRRLSAGEWGDAVTLVLREARRRVADAGLSSRAAAAWPVDVRID